MVSCGPPQPLFQIRRTLVVDVSDVESPGTVEGVGTFERELIADVVGVEAGGVLSGEIALESLHVFAGLGSLMMIGNNQRGGLQLMNEGVGFLKMPVGVGLVPHAVEPDAADGSVVGE